MKNILFFTFFIVLTLNSVYSQDTIRIINRNFTSIFSKSKKHPILVQWWLTKTMVNCKTPIPRKDNFKPDPKLPNETDIFDDYVGSGYDKGHLMPAADNLCQTQEIQDECFYFSNIIPQPHYSNAGPWKKIEVLSRSLSKKKDSIFIWAGGVGSVNTFGKNKVNVPIKTWKVIYIKKTDEFICYIFPNTNKKITNVESLKVRKEDVESLTGFKFTKM